MILGLGYNRGEVFAQALRNYQESGSAVKEEGRYIDSLLAKIYGQRSDRLGLRPSIEISENEASVLIEAIGEYFEDYFWAPQEEPKPRYTTLHKPTIQR